MAAPFLVPRGRGKASASDPDHPQRWRAVVDAGAARRAGKAPDARPHDAAVWARATSGSVARKRGAGGANR